MGGTTRPRAGWSSISAVPERDAKCLRTSQAFPVISRASVRCLGHAGIPPATRRALSPIGPRQCAPPAPARSGAGAPAPRNRRDPDLPDRVSASVPFLYDWHRGRASPSAPTSRCHSTCPRRRTRSRSNPPDPLCGFGGRSDGVRRRRFRRLTRRHEHLGQCAGLHVAPNRRPPTASRAPPPTQVRHLHYYASFDTVWRRCQAQRRR